MKGKTNRHIIMLLWPSLLIVRYGALEHLDSLRIYLAHNQNEVVMNNNCVVKLSFIGPQGQEYFLAVDFSTHQASAILVDPRNGNIMVTDVQSIVQRGG